MPSSADLAGRLTDLVLGYQRTQLVLAAVSLGLADEVARGSRTVGEVAAVTGAEPGSLRRLVDALASLDLLQIGDDGQLSLTPMGSLLRSDNPDSLRSSVLMHGQEFYPVWGELPETIRTGVPAFERVYGMPTWEYRRRHPDAGARFDSFMARAARDRAAGLVAAGRLPERGVIVDVGGGNGTLLATVLTAHPHMTGILIDQPHVVAAAPDVLARAGVSDRCDVIGGDFFTAVPGGGDVYLLSGVLLDWDDERAAQIVHRCRQAIRQSGELLLVDAVLPGDHRSSAAYLLDLHMLLTNTGGRVRGRSEWERLLAGTGFHLHEVIPTGLFAVLHARPAPARQRTSAAGPA